MSNFKINVGSNNTYIKIKKTAAPYGLSYKNASTENQETPINNFTVRGFVGHKIESENLKKPSISFIWENEDQSERQYLQFAIEEESAQMVEDWHDGDPIELARALTPSPFNQLLTFLYLGYFCPTAELYLSLKHDGTFFENKKGKSPNFKIWAEYKIGKVPVLKITDILRAGAGDKREIISFCELADNIKNTYEIAQREG